MTLFAVRDGRATMVTETREDGWPICPFCENDELACIKTTEPTPEAIDLCYVCGPVRIVKDWS